MKKLNLIWFFILLLPLVAALPPFQGTLSENAHLEIVYPKVDSYATNTDLSLNFMVINSTGYVLNSSAGEVLCWFTLQNGSNDVLIHEIATTNNFYFSQPVEANYTGIFSYEINCNSTNEYGYVSGYYYVTEYNKQYVPGESALTGIVIIIAVFSIGYLLLYLTFKLDAEKHRFLQLIILGFVVGISILIPKAAIDYASNYNTSVIFYTAITWFIRVFWAYMFFYILYEFFVPLAQKYRKRAK